MKKIFLVLFLILTIFSCNKIIKVEYTTNSVEQEPLSIMSFNIQIFGRAKSSNKEVMSVIVDIIDDYDLIAIQEVRDSTNQTIQTLKKALPEKYLLIYSKRDGRSISKEQALFIFNREKLWPDNQLNYFDPDDVFERSPYVTSFRIQNTQMKFQIINVHLSPGDVPKEMLALSKACGAIYSVFGQDLIILGDMNADGSYFDEDTFFDYFPDDQYELIIGNDLDTTVAESDNTYDRIIVSENLKSLIVESGVLYFEDYLGVIAPKEVSDHYPVYMKLYY